MTRRHLSCCPLTLYTLLFNTHCSLNDPTTPILLSSHIVYPLFNAYCSLDLTSIHLLSPHLNVAIITVVGADFTLQTLLIVRTRCSKRANAAQMILHCAIYWATVLFLLCCLFCFDIDTWQIRQRLRCCIQWHDWICRGNFNRCRKWHHHHGHGKSNRNHSHCKTAQQTCMRACEHVAGVHAEHLTVFITTQVA